MKCPYCKKNISNRNTRHVLTCDKGDSKTSNIDKKYDLIKYNFPEISEKNKLIFEYEINLKSLPDIQKEFGLNYTQTLFLLKYFDIKKRSLSESNSLITNNKNKIQWLEKYGVDNPSKLDCVKQKKKDTFLKNYGVDNVRKSDDFKKNLNDIMIKKYGKKRINNPNKLSLSNKLYWENLSEDERQKKIKRLCSHNITKIELKIMDMLNTLGVKYIFQYPINEFFIDFFLVEKNIALEIQGDFWHANPKKYKSTDILKHPGKKIIAEDIWMKDDERKKNIESMNIKVIYLWEDDIINKFETEIVNTIKKIII